MTEQRITLEGLPGIVITVGVIAIVLGLIGSILTQFITSPDLTTTETSLDSNQLSPVNGTPLFFGDYDSYLKSPTCSDVNIYRVP